MNSYHMKKARYLPTKQPATTYISEILTNAINFE